MRDCGAFPCGRKGISKSVNRIQSPSSPKTTRHLNVGFRLTDQVRAERIGSARSS